MSGGLLLCTRCAICFACLQSLLAAQSIREISADSTGDLEDWIEIANVGSVNISVDGWSLSDTDVPGVPFAPEGTVLPPGGIAVVVASGEQGVLPRQWKAAFKLRLEGETVTLWGPGGEILDRLEYPQQVKGVSYGCDPSHPDSFLYFLDPTPGKPNTTQGYREKPREMPVLSPAPGFLSTAVQVAIEYRPAEATLRYTLDGSEPDAQSPVFDKNLLLERTVVLRAAAFSGPRKIGRSATGTYFFEPRHDINVVTLVTAPKNLFDPEEGIYANPEIRDWERPAAIEFYDKGGKQSFAVDAGIRIHGNVSRRAEAKSFRVYFREQYGPKKLRNRVFEDPNATSEFDTLVLLRSDSWEACTDVEEGCQWAKENATFIADWIMRDLFMAMGQLVPRVEPVALYLNGQYWGLYMLSERIDQDFLQSYLGGSEWDVINPESPEEATDGDLVAWTQLKDLLRSDAIDSETLYAELLQEINRLNINTFYLLTIWSEWFDVLNNYRVVRRRDPEAQWLVIPWDCEFTFVSQADLWATLALDHDALWRIFAALVSQEEYTATFQGELLEAFDGVLSADSFRSRVTLRAAQLRTEIPRDALRWGVGSLEDWETAIERLKEFAARQNDNLPRLLRDKLPSLSLEVPEPNQVAGEKKIAVLLPAEAPTDDLKAVIGRLERRGLQVFPVDSRSLKWEDLKASADLVLLPQGIPTEDLAEEYSRNPVPLLFWEGQFLKRGAPLTPLRARTEFESILSQGEDHYLSSGLPTWRLKFFNGSRSVVFARGLPGNGVSAVASIREVGQSQGYAVLAADRGNRFADDSEVKARIVYFAMNEFRDLSGYGVVLFDRAVEWLLSNSRPFLRGDVNEDGSVDAQDVETLISYLFLHGNAPVCLDSADADDNGHINILDIIQILRCVYNAVPLPPPFPLGGDDSTGDDLSLNIGSKRRSAGEAKRFSGSAGWRTGGAGMLHTYVASRSPQSWSVLPSPQSVG